jgi:hypothetical protein
MRDALKNIFGRQISLEDGSQYSYSVQPFEMKNALGNIVAVLEEYIFTKKDSPLSYKIYRTKDGNWYEVKEPTSVAEYSVLRALKSAIASMEKQL